MLSKKEQKQWTYVLNIMLSNKLRLTITAFKEIYTYFWSVFDGILFLLLFVFVMFVFVIYIVMLYN